ncbi:NifB/NifX family molybdenum-iron cluster-binding protein [Aquitalea pelogenes]|uniref:NifB/NifX family molybdenum-iron cluster-binding protein n=1 Tax=Aquitalea pelogenes TaxID=1293573 RepID=UPI0035B2134C
MKIAIASQNRRTSTAHAGKCTHFWVVDSEQGSCVSLRLLPEQMLSQSAGLDGHPLQQVDVVLALSAGQPLAQRLAAIGTVLALTEESDPLRAAQAWLAGRKTAVQMPGKGRCQMMIRRA